MIDALSLGLNLFFVFLSFCAISHIISQPSSQLSILFENLSLLSYVSGIAHFRVL